MPGPGNEIKQECQDLRLSEASSTAASTRLRKELVEITLKPPPGCSAWLKKNDIYEWSATVRGPTGSVYEGGEFHLDLSFFHEYPFSPPQVRFRTKIYHCNINSGNGYVCLDILGDKWTPALTVSKVLLSISLLLADCNPHDPLVPDIAAEYISRRPEHDRAARLWTKRYATPCNKKRAL